MPTISRGAGALRSFWFGAAVLVVLQARSFGPARLGWDLPLWDGSLYYEGARRLVHSFASPRTDWAPLYSGYLALFNLLFDDTNPLGVYVVQRAVVQLGLALSMLWILRRITRPLLALVLAAWASAMACVADDEFVVHAFAIMPIAAALLVSTCERRVRTIGVPIALIAAALVRAELVAGLVVVLAWLVRDGLLGPRRRRAAVAMIPIVLLSICFLGREMSSGGRSWLAFGQHYAVGYGERHPEWSKDPWVFWQEPVRAAFGDAKSVLGAVRSNPGAVAVHVVDNVRSLPRGLVVALRPTWLPVRAAGFAFSAALVAIGIAAWLRLRRPGCTFKSLVRRRGVARARRMLPAALACGIPIVASLLVLRPMWTYVLMLVPLIVLAVGLALEVLVLCPIGRARATDLVLCATAAALLIARPAAAGAQPPSVAIAADALEQILRPGHPYRLLAMSASAFCGAYLRTISCKPLELAAIDWDQGAAAVAEHDGADVLLVDAISLQRLPRRLARDVIDLERSGWGRVPTAGSYAIYLRPEARYVSGLLR
jgi:hypothetical protein